MVLKRLNTAEMINLTAPWVQKGHPTRKLIQSIFSLEYNLRHVEGAHALLISRQPTLDSTLADLVTEAAAVDAQHDDVARGVQHSLEAAAWFERDPAKRKRLRQLQLLILPDGLSIVQRSYREEAGAAFLLESRLAPEVRAQLEAVPAPGGTLLDRVLEFIGAGKRLGILEDRRAAIEQSATPVAAADVVQARNQWIRAMHAFVENLELAMPDPQLASEILAPLRDAGQAADRRGARRLERRPTPASPEGILASPPPAPTPDLALLADTPAHGGENGVARHSVTP